MFLTLCALFILSACLHCCDAQLRLASYYGDHMVLQKSPARAVLWGYGPEGAHVTVSLSGPTQQRTSPVTVTEGIWRVTLDPVEPGGPYMVDVSSETSTVNMTDVLFGDIWVCGGQSNMQFQTSQVFNASSELALAPKYPHVRPFQAATKVSETELLDLIQVQIPWSVPTAGVMSEFSAVCWLFGRYLYDVLKYPIGLVESCWGGTPVEAWSSSRALQQCDLARVNSNPRNDSILWNSMIHPLLNMTIYGAIWYQGEANTGYHPNKYNCSFPAMIDDWRMAFHQGSCGQTDPDFPFGFVQLSTYTKNSTSEKYPNLRWHQTADTGFVPNSRMKKTFMAVALDLPDESSPYGTIHPRDKQDVAYRLTLGARAVAYNQTGVPFLGPFPKEILRLPNSIVVHYDQAISVTSSKDIYEICCSKTACGLNSLWVPAPILSWDSASVRISTASCKGSSVAGLRYAWKDWPCDFKACPVYSANKVLPAPPFISN
ncbi:sialate O-acetylesterase-like [Salarias fasciatus]|uniref:sialate O-acetylesterase-like n=1 Tax=Salarias fasciatus TaxID=181472 RepID=UPI001176EE8C|nr:sialate O-acetylesterase-like [Salarias fasciatus]